nr:MULTISPECIES: DUF6290 family protein [Providencia]
MRKNLTKAIRLNNEELSLFESYANAKGLTFSELCKSAIIEKIEDEIDLKLAEEAYEEYLNDSETLSHKAIFDPLWGNYASL